MSLVVSWHPCFYSGIPSQPPSPKPACGGSLPGLRLQHQGREGWQAAPAWPPWWLPRQRYARQQGTPPAARQGRQERPGCAHRSRVQPQEALIGQRRNRSMRAETTGLGQAGFDPRPLLVHPSRTRSAAAVAVLRHYSDHHVTVLPACDR